MTQEIFIEEMLQLTTIKNNDIYMLGDKLSNQELEIMLEDLCEEYDIKEVKRALMSRQSESIML